MSQKIEAKGSGGKELGYGLDGLGSIPGSGELRILNLRSALHCVQIGPDVHPTSFNPFQPSDAKKLKKGQN